MPVASLVSDKIHISAPLYQNGLVLQIPGVKWSKKENAWVAPLSWGTCLAMRGIFKESLEIEESLEKWAWLEHERIQTRLQAKKGSASASVLTGLGLYDFQRYGAAFLATAGSALLGDQCGLGKTAQAIVAVSGLPVLVVCPNSVKDSWKREFAKWRGNCSVSVVGGSAAQRRKALAPGSDVYILNYEAVKCHSRIQGYGSIHLKDDEKTPKELNALGFRTVIVDEAHRIKNPKAIQTRAIKAVASTASQRFALTGTPVANTPEDLWSIMNFVAPNEWPSYSRFRDRYLLSSPGFFGGMEIFGLNPDTKDEFYAQLDHRFLRRTKEEVLPELAAKKLPPQIRYVEMDAKQAKAYNALAADMIAKLDSGVLLATNPLTQMIRLRQAAAALPVLAEDGSVVALSGPSAKIYALLDIIDERAGAPLVVFAEHKLLIDLVSSALDKEGVRYGRITGSENATERAETVDLFQRKLLPVVLCTTGAGGEGITLTAADTLVFLQRSWSSIQNTQAEGRIDRISQEAETISIIDIVSSGTIEQAVIERYGEKLDQLEQVCRDKKALRELLSGF